ncbi:rhomboid family intramembrane serine protease [Postechiella marina]|uniref:Rhomboid family intramembrane serine protease n=1 Tax=Postechiella marina TaxID=943941 RepID=A0ABP8CGB3_9FLAO
MTSLNYDIKNKLSNLNVLEKIIAVNVIVFLVAFILGIVMPGGAQASLSWLELPSTFSELIVKPWTIITYAFTHYDFMHILFNMFLLYVIAKWFINLFNPKMALNVYFLGAMSGGFLFIVIYSLFPQTFGSSRLVGASAAVRALLIFLCAYMPNREMRFFTVNFKFWYLGAAVVILDVFGILGGIKDPILGNAGGNIAHLGGSALGYFYATQLLKGNDIGKGFEKLADAVVNMFKGSKKGPLKTVHKNKSKVGGYTKSDFNKFNNQKKIDIILDKISKSGYDSLTAEEKELLFRAGK